jgi:hypothetical protein
MITVTEVLEEVAKHGVSAKTGKEWSQARVGLSNGESVFIFNPIKVGDEVKEVQNGEYRNWVVVKPDPKHDEVMKALREIYSLLKEGPKQSGYDQAKAARQKLETLSPDDIPPGLFEEDNEEQV